MIFGAVSAGSGGRWLSYGPLHFSRQESGNSKHPLAGRLVDEALGGALDVRAGLVGEGGGGGGLGLESGGLLEGEGLDHYGGDCRSLDWRKAGGGGHYPGKKGGFGVVVDFGGGEGFGRARKAARGD